MNTEKEPQVDAIISAVRELKSQINKLSLEFSERHQAKISKIEIVPRAYTYDELRGRNGKKISGAILEGRVQEIAIKLPRLNLRITV
jgi:hypothetical protein